MTPQHFQKHCWGSLSMQCGSGVNLVGKIMAKAELIPFTYILTFGLGFYLFMFREMWREEEREEERHRCVRDTQIGCLSHTRNWGPGPQPRHVPWLGTELTTFQFTDQHSIHYTNQGYLHSLNAYKRVVSKLTYLYIKRNLELLHDQYACVKNRLGWYHEFLQNFQLLYQAAHTSKYPSGLPYANIFCLFFFAQLLCWSHVFNI